MISVFYLISFLFYYDVLTIFTCSSYPYLIPSFIFAYLHIAAQLNANACIFSFVEM